MRIRLFPDSNGEPRLYSHSTNYNRRDKKPRRSPHGAWWLYWPGNSFRVEWVVRPGMRGGIWLAFDSADDMEISFGFGIPLLVTLYMGIGRFDRLMRLLGLTWPQVRGKRHRDWKRELSARWHNGALWLCLWDNPDESSRDDRQYCIDPANILFGRRKYSTSPKETHTASLTLPEGTYPLTVSLYTATWKRPRWPRAVSIQRADIDAGKRGIPTPGKGENAWDCDDDATFGMTCPATSVEEAVEMLRASILRDRERYGGPGWRSDSQEAAP